MSLTKGIAKTIGIPVARNKDLVVGFLNDNLVFVSQNISDQELISIMIDNFGSNPSLYEKYVTWLQNYALYSNAEGDSSGGFGFNMGSITDLLGTAAGIFGNVNNSKAAADVAKAQAAAAAAAANAQANTNATNLQIAQLQLAAQMGKPAAANTGLYIGLGIAAVSVIGVVIYFIAKK